MNLIPLLLWTGLQPISNRFFSLLALAGEPGTLPSAPESSFGALIYAFVLIFLLFLLINLDRRFREYISRALIRPFNFFADIRDQRLIPNVQTTILAVVLSGALAGCVAALLRIALSVPASARALQLALPASLYSKLSNIALDYTMMLFVFTLVALGSVLLLTLFLRFAAIFVRGRILLGDTYNIAVWALLPAAFLLPYDLIVPRMDLNGTTSTISLVLLGVLFLWSFYRLLKGTGVLFDVYPTKIYLYGTGVLGIVAIILYFYLRHNHVFENFSFVSSVLRATGA